MKGKTFAFLMPALVVAGMSGPALAGHDQGYYIGHTYKSPHAVRAGHVHRQPGLRHGHRRGHRHSVIVHHYRPPVLIHHPAPAVVIRPGYYAPGYYYHAYPGPSAHLHYARPRAGISLHLGY